MTLAGDDKYNPIHGITNEDRSLFGILLSAAALAAAGYSAYKAYDIACEEWEMAKKYWRIANNWLEYYKNYYAPVEDQEVEEALALEYVEPEYEIARGRSRTSAWILFKGKLKEAFRSTTRYSTGLRVDMLMRLARAQADAVALADGLGYRNERAYVETRNDVIFQRKLETAKRGRDMVAEAPSLAMASAGIYGDLADQAWNGLVGAGQYLGYRLNRRGTPYPVTSLDDGAQYVEHYDVSSLRGEQLMDWLHYGENYDFMRPFLKSTTDPYDIGLILSSANKTGG